MKKTNAAAQSAVAPVTNEVVVDATVTAADPFADVPVTRIGDDVSFKDFTDAPTNNPYKYASVHEQARAERSPMLVNYKHGKAMITSGTNRKEFKPGSVYGTIQAIGNAAGRAGVPIYVLLTQLRQAQIGNKRSKYCTQLPPVGWGEGWVNTAITKGIIGVHPSKTAPTLGSEAAAEASQEGEQKLVANG